jgi:hypothetical protein
MKVVLKLVCAALLLCGTLASAPASAHGRVFFGFNFGVPLFPPAYYYPPPPVYYYPPAVAAAPPVYVERSAPQYVPPPDSSWYYCPDSKTYYPYVKDCASPWQRVPSRPPAP